jgi:hypothetical protein
MINDEYKKKFASNKTKFFHQQLARLPWYYYFHEIWMRTYQDDLVGKTFYFFLHFVHVGSPERQTAWGNNWKRKKKMKKISESDLMRSDKTLLQT